MFRGSHLGDLTEPLTGRSWNHDEVLRRVIARIGYYGEQGVPAATAFLFSTATTWNFRRPPRCLASRCEFVPVDARLTAFEIENVARR
jgi:hypothetical protein